LEIEEEVTGCWNQSGIRRVLENLVNNAVKYGSHARPIRISLLKKSHHIQLRVHNEGPPIPEGEQSKLFHPFQRTVSAQAGPKKGWGLGLTLVKGIAEAHGGRVELKSDYNSGTTFSVLLPIDARSNSCAHSSLI
jgi:signal transduction histidine kinase